MKQTEKIRKEIERLKAKYGEPMDDYSNALNDVLSFIESLEKEPNIKGYVARDEDATLHFFSSECGDGEPIYDKDYGAWGIATGEMIELPRQSGPFGDLSYRDEPVEVELTIHRV